jgi:hypothetical protein
MLSLSYKLQAMRGVLGFSYIDTNFQLQLYFSNPKAFNILDLQSFESMGFMFPYIPRVLIRHAC